MVNLELNEAQLFRMLSGFFGRDRVFIKMSVLTVCGGSLPEAIELGSDRGVVNMQEWARRTPCLFTVVDHDDHPRMVIEFFSGYSQSIVADEVDHQRFLRPVLRAAQIPYITISREEFDEVLDPQSSLDFFALIESKFSEFSQLSSQNG